jgi:hypothetical protein
MVNFAPSGDFADTMISVRIWPEAWQERSRAGARPDASFEAASDQPALEQGFYEDTFVKLRRWFSHSRVRVF